MRLSQFLSALKLLNKKRAERTRPPRLGSAAAWLEIAGSAADRSDWPFYASRRRMGAMARPPSHQRREHDFKPGRVDQWGDRTPALRTSLTASGTEVAESIRTIRLRTMNGNLCCGLGRPRAPATIKMTGRFWCEHCVSRFGSPVSNWIQAESSQRASGPTSMERSTKPGSRTRGAESTTAFRWNTSLKNPTIHMAS